MLFKERIQRKREEVTGMIPVLDAYGVVVTFVRYNCNLDFWDGRNWTCGAVGRHKGLTRLKDGRFVIIYGTDWTGERDHGEFISAKDALQEILYAEAYDVLEKYFPDYKHPDNEK